MKHKASNLESVIVIAASITLAYLFSIFLNLQLAVILGLYLLATISTLYMALKILKDPYSTQKTFDEYFYEDRDDIRRCGSDERRKDI